MQDEPKSSAIAKSIARVDYDVFLSYSRRDKAFSQRLCRALMDHGKQVWVDWDNIAPAEDWREAMYQGIQAARNFIFVISPHSLVSEHCQDELKHALAYNKRLIPVLWEDIDSSGCHPALARHNWVFSRHEDNFEQALQKVLNAIDIEIPYVRSHTWLFVKAQAWQNNGQDPSFLLRGSELRDALTWLDTSTDKEPQPTDLHRDFIHTSIKVEKQQQAQEMALRRMTPQQVRNRNAILSKVRKIWVEGVLESSLHDQILINLGIENRPEAVASSWNLELAIRGQTREALSPTTKVVSIFDKLGDGRTLLILGEPGAGKTTTLLELAQDLLQRAEQGLDHRIPLVLNLSSWAIKRQSMPVWVVDELNVKYQVPKTVGKEWVRKQELVLLLDGLDEVAAGHREACIAELNTFHRDYGPEMVVCSRLQDYEMLSGKLTFQQALYLRALTQDQICYYLQELDTDLSGLWHLLETDTALRELAHSPLNLNLMAMAYQGVAQEDMPQASTLEERRSQLFDTYIQRMLRRPIRVGEQHPYSDEQTIGWLSWLAQRLMQESQTIFLIEQMQPSWLDARFERLLFRVGFPLVMGIVFAIFWTLFYALTLRPELQSRATIFGLIAGFIFAIVFAINGGRIYPIENLKWSWKNARRSLPHSLLSAAGFVGLFLIIFWALGFQAYIVAVTYGLLLGVLVGLGNAFRGVDVKTKLYPNQGIWQSARNSLAFGVSMGIISALTMGTVDFILRNEAFYEAYNIISLLRIALFFGLLAGMIGGGKALLQHVLLRYRLYRQEFIPWNYARFLGYCCDRIFLQKVGGGYIFIHRLLLEHLAALGQRFQ